MDAKIIDCVLDLALTIQQIPAPTFDEGRRAMFVYEHFLAEGLTEVSIDAEGNVYGKIPGTGLAPPLVVSARLDTVFPVSTDLKIKREAGKVVGPGIGDNAVGVAGLFGLLWALRAKTVGKDLNINREPKQYDPWIPILPGDVWLVANVGEEGLGDLHGMKAIIDRFGEQVLGYIVVEGLSFGKVYNRGLSVQRYKILGAHTWRALLGGSQPPICCSRAGRIGNPLISYSFTGTAAFDPECGCNSRWDDSQHHRSGGPPGT